MATSSSGLRPGPQVSWDDLARKVNQDETQKDATAAQTEAAKSKAGNPEQVEVSKSHSGGTDSSEKDSLVAKKQTSKSASGGPALPDIDRPSSDKLKQLVLNRSTGSLHKSLKDANPKATYAGAEQATSRSEPGHTPGPHQDHVVSSLRTQALSHSARGNDAVPASERVNNMRRVRSNDASVDRLKKDPTLSLPPKSFEKQSKGLTERALVYAQRPGPETQWNTVNRKEAGKALQSHFAGNQSRPSSGGFPQPASKTKEREKQAVGVANAILWDPKTSVQHQDRTQPEKVPQNISQGKITTYKNEDGQGVRFGEASASDGAKRTLVGFLNPSTWPSLKSSDKK